MTAQRSAVGERFGSIGFKHFSLCRRSQGLSLQPWHYNWWRQNAYILSMCPAECHAAQLPALYKLLSKGPQPFFAAFHGFRPLDLWERPFRSNLPIMASFSRLTNALVSATNENTFALANINLDFSVLRVDAPKVSFNAIHQPFRPVIYRITVVLLRLGPIPIHSSALYCRGRANS